jgi:anti-anti-sigma factor
MPDPNAHITPISFDGPDAVIRIESVESSDGEMLIELVGEVRIDSAMDLPRWILEYYARDMPSRIVLEFARVEFVDSQGLALLFSLHKSLTERHCSLAIRHASPHISSLIEMTRLVDYIALLT